MAIRHTATCPCFVCTGHDDSECPISDTIEVDCHVETCICARCEAQKESDRISGRYYTGCGDPVCERCQAVRARKRKEKEAKQIFCDCKHPIVNIANREFCLECKRNLNPREQYREESTDEGRKDDNDKDPWGLLPTPAMREVVKVLQHGKKKYAAWNWAKGISYSRLYDGVQRHLTSFYEREDNDPESNLSHLAHAICGTMFLLTLHILKRNDLDDRPDYKAYAALNKFPQKGEN